MTRISTPQDPWCAPSGGSLMLRCCKRLTKVKGPNLRLPRLGNQVKKADQNWRRKKNNHQNPSPKQHDKCSSRSLLKFDQFEPQDASMNRMLKTCLWHIFAPLFWAQGWHHLPSNKDSGIPRNYLVRWHENDRLLYHIYITAWFDSPIQQQSANNFQSAGFVEKFHGWNMCLAISKLFFPVNFPFIQFSSVIPTFFCTVLLRLYAIF